MKSYLAICCFVGLMFGGAQAWADGGRPFLGIVGETAGEGAEQIGAVVRSVAPDGPAEKAGIQVGDRIVRMGSDDIKSFEDLRVRLGQFAPGDMVECLIMRGEEEVRLKIEIGSAPDRPERDQRRIPNIQRFQFRVGPDGQLLPGDDEFPGIEDLQKRMAELMTPRMMVGMHLQPIDDNLREALKLGDVEGVLVSGVTPGGPADQAGVKSEDVIVEAAGQKMTSPEQFKELVQSKKAGESLALKLVRQGEPVEANVEIVEGLAGRGLEMFGGQGGVLSMPPAMEDRLKGIQERLGALEQSLEERVKDRGAEIVDRLKEVENATNARIDDRLDAIEKRLESLQSRLQKGSDDVRDRLEQRLDALQKRIDELAQPALNEPTENE